jgi:threonine 3-dehydrogenase
MTVIVQSGLDIGPVIADRFSASDYDQAFATAANGASDKAILEWEMI